MSTFLLDLRFGARLFLRNPGLTATAVLTLALGIGANTAVFSALDAVLIRPMPYRDSERLVMIWEDASFVGFPRNTPAPGNYAEWAKRNTVFTGMAALRSRRANLTGFGSPEVVAGRGVTANLFEVLGVTPLLGRVFTEDEDRRRVHVVVISHGLWQRRFAGEPSAVGRDILMNGEKTTVIGVMPRGFSFPRGREEYWAPAGFTPEDLANRGGHFLNVVARLKPGVTLERARSEMDAIARRLQREFPATNRSVGAVVVPLREELTGETGTALPVLLAAAGFVLLIACTNVASLMLARGWARQREIAVRSALGAGRGRLIRQMLTEALLFAAAGAGLGLLIARWSLSLLKGIIPLALSNWVEISLNGRVLAFTAAIAVATAVLFGLAPALQAGRIAVSERLKQGGRSVAGGGLAWRALVSAEVGLALVLLVGAALMVRTLMRFRALDLGFRAENLITMQTPLTGTKYASDERRRAFFDRVCERTRAIPGVVSAGFASNLPFTSIGNTRSFRIEGLPEPPPGNSQDALYREVTPDYLATMRVRLRQGRLPGSSDGAESAPVAVINETFARAYFAGTPLGHRLTFGSPRPGMKWYTIVGVVEDLRERGFRPEAKPAVYVSVNQVEDPEAFMLVVRAAGNPTNLLNDIRRAIWSVDPEQPVTQVRSMEEILDLDVAGRRQQMAVLATFAGIALALAAIGIYGVLSFAVTQRTREIGLRMALGATRAEVIGMVAGQGLKLALAGAAAGTVTALLSMRALASFLYGVTPTDAATYALMAALLLAVSIVACVAPARRAARIDPITALRDE